MTISVDCVPGRTNGTQLSNGQREILLGIISENPLANNRKIAEMFVEVTGRPFTRNAVRPYRNGNVGLRKSGKSQVFPDLTTPEKDIMLRIMEQNPKLDPIEVVAMFAEIVSGASHA